MFRKFIAVVFSVAAAVLSVSCSDSSKDEILGCNTWFQKDFTYKNTSKDGTVVDYSVTAFFLYSDGTYSNSKLRSGINIVEGLNVVFIDSTAAKSQSTLDSIKGLFGQGKYFYFKSFPANQNVHMEDAGEGVEKSGFTLTMTPAKWTAFYIANIKEFTRNGSSTVPPAPINSTYESSYSSISDFKELKNFSLKQLLLQGLINYLGA